MKTSVDKIRSVCDRIETAEKARDELRSTFSEAAWIKLRRDTALTAFISSSRVLGALGFIGRVVGLVKRASAGRRPAFASPQASTRSSKQLAVGQARGLTSRDLIFVDITAAHRDLVGGGIKRACLEISDALTSFAEARPCVTMNGDLYALGPGHIVGDRLHIEEAHTYVVLDAFWEPFDVYEQNLSKCRRSGVRTAVCVYDAIPIMHPELVDDDWAQWFRRCYVQMLPHIDLLISVSRSSAAEVERVTRSLDFEKPVSWFHLGSDAFRTPVRPERTVRPSFTSIGTLEPKKGYEMTLDAFDIVWSKGIDVDLTIIGKEGWLCSALVSRIKRHHEFDHRLFWLDSASDADVADVLAGTYCYIQASLAEGFGLPVVEAARRGLPVIASDLPVFREISIANVVFFPVCDPGGLAEAILHAVTERPEPAQAIALTWKQSAEGLLRALRTERPPDGRM